MQEIHDTLRDHAVSVPALPWFWHGYISEMIRDARDLDGNRVFDSLHDDEIPAAVATLYAKVSLASVLELLTDCMSVVSAAQELLGADTWASREMEGGAAFYHARNSQAAGFRAANWPALHTLEKLAGCYEPCWLQWSHNSADISPTLQLRNSFSEAGVKID